MAQQFLLEGQSLDEVTREALALYGAGTRIVRAERVLDPGLAGFLGRRHLEVTVEVPDPRADRVPTAGAPGSSPRRLSEPVAPPAPVVHVLDDRAGILALLEQADRAEADVNAPSAGARAPGVVGSDPLSTESSGLGELLTRLDDAREHSAAGAGGADDRGAGSGVGGAVRSDRVPAPLTAPGDLVLVLGLEDTALHVVRSMVAHAERVGDTVPLVHGAGAIDLPGRPHVADRWDAVRARAQAVEAGVPALTAYALGSPTAGLAHLEGAAVLGADQVWVVVDARHKPDETSQWVERVRAALEVDALAVVGAGDSRSAHTVNALGVPLGWKDGQPAPWTVL